MSKRHTLDASGFRVFDKGELGRAHVLAHRALDEGRMEEGHRELSLMLSGATGKGSAWVHLQWHMVLFELAVGAWDEAHARYEAEVLPAAASTMSALTDGPAGLWRLALSPDRPEGIPLPWEAIRATALQSLERGPKPYVELHNLLALAGARDVAALSTWLDDERDAPGTLRLIARGLRCYAAGHYAVASMMLETALPRVSEIGGSGAQNELFAQIRSRADLEHALTDHHADSERAA